MTRSCEAFLQDPEVHRDHLAECASCRLLEASLAGQPEVVRQVSPVMSFPVAPWEGAGHHSWGVVLGIAILLFVAAGGLFALVGVSPLAGFAAALRSLAPRMDVFGVAGSFSKLIREAPIQFHAFVLIGFLVVNGVFVALLRRPTKGYDVTLR